VLQPDGFYIPAWSEQAGDLSREKVYHRRESPTQTPEVARLQEASGQIWGTCNRDHMGGRSPFPSVDAFVGPLVDPQRGIEFVTDVPPDRETPPRLARWTGPRPGVRVEGDYAKIRAVVTRNTQRE
jgi:hypothetical protein